MTVEGTEQEHGALVAQCSDHVEIRVEDLTVVQVEPGDMILVRCPKWLTMDSLRAVHNHVQRHFPGHEVLVVDEGIELALLRPPQFKVVCAATTESLLGGQLQCVLDEGHDAGSPTRIHRTADGARFSLTEATSAARQATGEPR